MAQNTKQNDLLSRLESGLGKDKPYKLWIDSDCCCFTSHSTLLRAHESQHPNDVDDGWALCAVLNSDRCNLIGVSSSYGNDTEEVAYKDLKKCLSLHPKGKHVKVHRGAKPPLPLLAGIGAYNDTKCLVTSTNDAVEALKHTLESLNKDEKLVIYADGPATNISTLLLLYPQLSKKIDFVLLFMGRDTVTHPKFAVGTTNTLFDLYFSDFNFDLDGYAVEVLIKSHISLVFVGGEVANQSMWLNRNDLIKIHENVKKKNNNNNNINKLIVELSGENNYKHWIKLFSMMGFHISPWNKEPDNPKIINPLRKIDGFIPFGLIAAIVLVGSEYYNFKNVNPSLPIIRQPGKVVFKTPIGEDHVDVTTSVDRYLGGHHDHSNSAKPVAKESKENDKDKEEDDHGSGTDGTGNKSKNEKDNKSVEMKLSDSDRKLVEHFRQAGQRISKITQHALRTACFGAATSTDDDDVDKNVDATNSDNKEKEKEKDKNEDENKEKDLKKHKSNEFESMGKAMEHLWTGFSKLFMHPPTYYMYCLCTNDDPRGKAKYVWTDKPSPRDDVLYVPTVKGEYPFKNYKKFVVDLLQKDVD